MKKRRGFTLLLATLVASATLTVGAAVYMIAVKEIDISRLGRDSQFAFYAADTGAECALYWDLRYNYFDLVEPTDPQAADPQCDEESINAQGRGSGPGGGYPQTMTFRFEPNELCADVFVTKDNPDPNTVYTTIRANGYSVACAELATAPHALQRSVELNY